ncbi:hypothetical protein IEQ34_016040 [Dendrobium chrysotoxum]|uniref:Uncharacterized protein n=1 Tax=Dendrobium chrysotoxum TaxID=161865 RepID=A0AAV7GCZ9_DENCH|nr:hypothetical protein IEQ34_016040 [Dendrobium chrysotoxum]
MPPSCNQCSPTSKDVRNKTRTNAYELLKETHATFNMSVITRRIRHTVEMTNSCQFKAVGIGELPIDFYTNSGRRKPDQIIIFIDEKSESQFNQVLNIELDKII